MKIAAILFGFLGSVMPVLGVWIAMSDFSAGGHWKIFHTIAMTVALAIELVVLTTVALMFRGKTRVALWGAGLSIAVTVAVVFLVIVGAGQFAGRWH